MNITIKQVIERDEQGAILSIRPRVIILYENGKARTSDEYIMTQSEIDAVIAAPDANVKIREIMEERAAQELELMEQEFGKDITVKKEESSQTLKTGNVEKRKNIKKLKEELTDKESMIAKNESKLALAETLLEEIENTTPETYVPDITEQELIDNQMLTITEEYLSKKESERAQDVENTIGTISALKVEKASLENDLNDLTAQLEMP